MACCALSATIDKWVSCTNVSCTANGVAKLLTENFAYQPQECDEKETHSVVLIPIRAKPNINT